MKRRTLLFIAVLFLLGVAAALYFFYVRPPAGPGDSSFFRNLPIIDGRGGLGDTEPPPPPPPGTLPAGDAERPAMQVVDKEVIGATLSADSKSLLYILRENGHVLTSDLDGKNETIVTNLTVLEIFDAVWSPKRDRVAVRYPEGSAVKTFLLGVATGTASRFLPQETTSLDWSPDGRSIAYLLRRNNETSLVIADANNQNPRVLYTTPVPDFTIRWVSTNTILLISKPSGLAPSLILRFDIPTRSAAVLLANTNGVVVAPTADGTSLAFSQSAQDGKAEPLSLFVLKRDERTSLDHITIAEKCVFSADGKKLYCGVPQGTILAPSPDEWYKGVTSFTDAVLEIDLEIKETKTLLQTSADVDVIAPFVTKDDNYLYFVDKKTSTFWRIAIESPQS